MYELLYDSTTRPFIKVNHELESNKLIGTNQFCIRFIKSSYESIKYSEKLASIRNQPNNFVSPFQWKVYLSTNKIVASKTFTEAFTQKAFTMNLFLIIFLYSSVEIETMKWKEENQNNKTKFVNHKIKWIKQNHNTT